MDEFEEILISTPIDKIIQIIKDEREVTSSYLALKTKYDQSTIEEWVRYLEREGIVEIRYQFNEMYISWNAPKKEEVEARKEKVKSKIEGVESKIAQLKEDVEIEIKIVYEIVEQLGQKIEQIASDKEKLTTFLSQFQKFREDLEKDISLINRDIEKTASQIDDKYRQISSLAGMIAEATTSDISQTEQELRRSIDEKMKLIENRLKDLDVYLEKLSTFSDKDVEVLKDKLEEMKRIRDLLESSKNIEQELKDIVRRYEYILEVLTEREKLLNELQELENRNIEIQKSLTNMTGTIFEINDKLQKIVQDYYELQSKSAELATNIKNNQDILRNIEIGDTSAIERASAILEELRSIKEELQSFDKLAKDAENIIDRLQDIGKVRANLERYRREYLLEVAKYAELVNDDLKTLETLLDIKKRLISELSEYKETILGYEDEFKKYVKIFIEQKESFNSMKNILYEMMTSGEMAEGLKKIQEVLVGTEQLNSKLEEARRLLVELEEIKININIINKELNLIKLRTPETEKEIEQKLSYQEKALKEQQVKRQTLEDWIRGFTKK